MSRDERVFHYQNLLLIAALPFALLIIDTMTGTIELPVERHCDVYHENAKIGLKCQVSPD